jgi:DNA-binding CsgD family transcriptional regulator
MTVRNDLEGYADLDRLLAGTRSGEGGCLVLRGGPGAGKTALLEYAVDRAADMRPVRVSGAASETEFRFAALHQMLAPFLAGLDRLPSPQRHALRRVVGLAHGPNPDRFLVGLAVLTLLAAAASHRPLLIVVDEAQWLDQASAEVLAFVGRRLQGEPIAVVVAMRVPVPPSAPFAGLPDRNLGDQPESRSALAVVPQPRSAVGCSPDLLVRSFQAAPTLLQTAGAESQARTDAVRGAAASSGLRVDAAVPARTNGLARIGERIAMPRQLTGSALGRREVGWDRAHAAVAAAVEPRPWHGDLRSRRDQLRALGDATGPAGAPPRPPANAPVSLLHDGIAVRDAEGYPAAVLMLRPVVTALLAEPDGADSELFAMACTAAGELLDDGAQHAIADRWVRAERDRSRPKSLPLALSALARVEVLAGRLASAEANLAEAHQVAAADARPSATAAARMGELTVLAWRGRHEQAESAADHLRDGSGAAGPDASANVVQASLTVLDLASGRYPAALARALDVQHDDPPDLGTRILPDLVEAASRTGDRAAATAALDRLAERAVASGTPLALGLLARSRALLADGTTADGLYREASAYLKETSQTPQLARTHLLHGEWLRRQRRHRDARKQLVAAADMFEAMGMNAFVQRARAELRATAERIGRRSGDTDNELTPQEAQIAQLVTDGLTNREIATQLFISSNTVEYHLHKVFRKFAVASRTQLTRAMLTGNPSPAASRGSPTPASR